jgi:hypothetical protein
VLIVLVAVLSLGAVLTLMAWSPDLSARDRAGPTPYSRSSTGYAGLTNMLEARGQPVAISRRETPISNGGGRLLILTLPFSGPSITSEDIGGPALIVLPKWTYRTNPARRSWEIDANLEAEERVEAVAARFDETVSVKRADNPGRLDTPFGPINPDFEDQMQLMRSQMLQPVIASGEGILFGQIPDRDIYILADPDLLNNFGLSRTENARAGLDIVDFAAGGRNQPVVFDATLHGFEQSRNLLKILLDIPYLGATLIALAAMVLTGWAATIRFGAPEREVRAIAAGKRALADNTAGLITMAKRDRRMAPGYLALSRRALARELGLPKTLTEAETNALLDRMGEQSGLESRYRDLQAGLSQPARSREDLKHKARALWRWRKEMTHGR